MKIKRHTEQINIRISRQLLDDIENCADKLGISVSEYIRAKMAGVVLRSKRRDRTTC
ncbi:plasmid mobilization protein [Oceanicoccus sagamiensis]|uniref:plasmid mobilization protein n=1 Tax=Oceanicoccus sagamiensis TaxID=716816 RepID=UPI0012F48AE4